MADTPDLGSGAHKHEGSSPSIRTLAGIAQLVEQPIRNRQVPSSSLGVGSIRLGIGSAPGSGPGSASRLWMM